MPQRPQPPGHQHPRLDRGARGDDRRPAAVLQPALGGQRRRHLAEQLGLQLGEPGQRPAHPACRVVLGQPVGRHDVRDTWRRARQPGRGSASRSGYWIDTGLASCWYTRLRSGDSAASKCAGSGPSCSPFGTNSAALPSACRMNGSAPPSAAGAGRARRGHVARRLVLLEVRHVVAGPLARLLVPPDVGLGFAPRLARPGRPRPGCTGCGGWPATPSPTPAPPRTARATDFRRAVWFTPPAKQPAWIQLPQRVEPSSASCANDASGDPSAA